MQPARKQNSAPNRQTLQKLRDSLKALDKGAYWGTPDHDVAGIPSGAAKNTPRKQARFQLEPGVLHEIFADHLRDAGPALGFCLAGVAPHLTPARPALLWLQLTRDAQQTGLPFGYGLARQGIDPQSLVIGRLRTLPDLLWAIEEAAACRFVAAIIADIATSDKMLDFTVSRRLQMRASASGTTILLARYGTGREASGARFRWRVAPALSEAPPFDARAPGRPAFAIDLEKGRLSTSAARPDFDELRLRPGDTAFTLHWTKNGLTRPEKKGPPRPRPAAPRLVSAALGNRVPRAG